MNIGIDHGYYAIKTRHCSFPAGLTAYGSHEPYTRQGLLESGGCFFVCGTGRQPIQRDKTINDNYYLLTLAALAQEIRSRGAPTECTVRIAAGLPLTSYGRDKPKFRGYLLRPSQPVQFRYEGVEYSITIADVQLFPQGFAALMAEPDLLTDEPSLLLMDIGGWTVDLMRIDNALPVAETAHSLELGMIRCIDEIRERVRQETGLSLTDAQIEQMLAGQPCSLSDEVRSIVNKQGRLYTERLFSAVMEAGFDLHAMPLVMLGGGACIVNRHVSPKDALCRVNPPTAEELAEWRADLAAAWPYTEDDPEPSYFDWIPDPARSDATIAMELLKASGNWTEEDERIAFDPSKPPPRPFEELEAEHDAFIERLMKDAKPL